MIFFDIRTLGGASLFADKSCVCLSIAFSRSDKQRLQEFELQACEAFDTLMAQVKADVSRALFDSSGEPFFFDAVTGLTVFFLKELGVYQDGPWLTKGSSGGLLHIAFSDDRAEEVVFALKFALGVAAQIYPKELAELFPDGRLLQNPVTEWDSFFKQNEQSSEDRTLRAIQASLNRRKIPWISLERYSGTRNFIQVGYGRYQYLFEGTISFECSLLGVSLSYNKRKSREYLASMGFPVTRQREAPTAEAAVTVAEIFGYPVVVKPVRGSHGNNVHVNLRDRAEVLAAFQTIEQTRRRNQQYVPNPIFVEEFVQGGDYRMTVVGEQVIIFHRLPAQVTGDGEHSILELVELENQNPLRGEKGELDASYMNLKLDAPELAVLEKYSLTTDAVPPAGKTVLLRENANWSSGGIYEDVTVITHPDNVALAKRIADALKIDPIGVDVIAKDIGRSFLDDELLVIEVNHSPAIFGVEGDDVSHSERKMSIVDHMAPLAAGQDVPIIIVSRSAFSVELTEVLGKALSGFGLSPGVVNQAGMFVKGDLWASKDSLDYSDPVLPVLRNKEIDAAVIERKFLSLVDSGVGTGGCDIAVILSVPPVSVKTAVWKNGIALSKAAEMLLQSSRKASVVWVDDPMVAACIECVPPSSLCILSKERRSGRVEGLISRGAKAVILESIDLDGITVRIIDSNSGREGKGGELISVAMTLRGEGSVLTMMAVLGVMICLDYSLEQFARPNVKPRATKGQNASSKVFNHNVISSGPEWVELSRLHSSRALCITEASDVIQLPSILLPQGAAIAAHYERIGLGFTRKVIWDLSLERAFKYPDYQPSVYFFGDTENRVFPDEVRYLAANELNSKNDLITVARKLGVSVPPTLCFDQVGDVEAKFNEVVFPCYVKPAISLAGIGISRCSNLSELILKLSKLPPGIPLQIQKEIPTQHFISVQYSIQNGSLERLAISDQIIEGYTHKGNRFPSQYSLGKMLDELAEYVHKQGLQEVFGFDVAVVDEGECPSFYLLECNPRFNSGSYSALLARKIGADQWSTATFSTRQRDLNEIDLSGIEYDPTTQEGVILVNWGTILRRKLVVMLVGSQDRQKALSEEFNKRVTVD